MNLGVLLVGAALICNAQSADQKPIPPDGSGIARLAELERENSELKSKLIECLTARATTVGTGSESAATRARGEAVSALQAMRAAPEGSPADFRRYYLDAVVKVESVPTEVAERVTLKSIIAIYADANRLIEIGTHRSVTIFDVEILKDVRLKYVGEINPTGCQGISIFGSESVEPTTFSRCASTLCDLAAGRLAEALLPKELAKGKKLWRPDGTPYGEVDALDPDHLFLDGTTGFGVCVKLTGGGYKWHTKDAASRMLNR